MGFPRTPFLTVAENLPLYRQSQGRTGIFLSGLVFSVHLLADDPTDGVCGVLLHLGRSVGVRVIMYPKSLQRTISMIRDFARRQLSCSARSGFLAFPGGATL